MNAARCLALLVALALAGCQKAPAGEGASAAPAQDAPAAAATDRMPVVPLTVRRADGTSASFQAEVALDKAAQERGLAGRETLAADGAMIFPFERLQPGNFWMKDTPIALDHLFVRADGSIAAILPGKPNDLTPISTGEPVRAVIQIGGGRAKALGIASGDKVRWGACRPTAPRPPEAWDRLAFCP